METNTDIRILVAEDDASTSRLFKKALLQEDSESSFLEIERLAAKLFGKSSNKVSHKTPADLVICRQAEEAVETLKLSLEESRPFSVVFLDVRMPPGPNGVWAAEQIRILDPNIEIVIVTSYSDINPEEIARRVPPLHKLLYLQKPIHLQEIAHLAYALSSKWFMEKTVLHLNETLEKEVSERTIELTSAYETLRLDIARREMIENERKTAEKHNKKLESMLRQSQKMEVIGTLAGGIAHDFNNILSSIMGYAQLAQLSSPENGKPYEYIQKLLIACDRATGLVKQILTFSRQSGTEKKPIDIGVVVKEAITLLRSALPASIEVQSEITPKPGIVMANQEQIHQVVMNLCTNAFQAMENYGGILKIALISIELDHKTANVIQEIPPGRYLKLSISDTGCGIPPVTMKHIFDPYFTTRDIGKGTGIGLATVHGIVRDHGGAINVTSTVGTGSIFHVYLPVLEGHSVSDPVELKPCSTGSERILFVDDEKYLVDIWYQMLTSLGYRVDTRNSPFDAIEAFRANVDKFDLVITDMNMPGMTGRQLSLKLKSIRPDIPILMCTGFSDTLTLEKAKADGISNLLLKPLSMQALSEAIRTELDKKTDF